MRYYSLHIEELKRGGDGNGHCVPVAPTEVMYVRGAAAAKRHAKQEREKIEARGNVAYIIRRDAKGYGKTIDGSHRQNPTPMSKVRE